MEIFFYGKKVMEERKKLNEELMNVVAMIKFKKLYDRKERLRDRVTKL